MSFATALPDHLRPRREKVFGDGRPRPLDRNAKARIMTLARALMRRTEKGKAYGQITAKALAVLEALLWGFHNARSGLCFPSYETIADRAGCARSTVAEAIKALEDAGLAVLGEPHQARPGAVRGPYSGTSAPAGASSAPATAIGSMTRKTRRSRVFLPSPIFSLEPQFKILIPLLQPLPYPKSTSYQSCKPSSTVC